MHQPLPYLVSPALNDVGRDERLYRVGDPFSTLHAIRFGHFKTSQLSAAGAERITRFA